MNIFHIVGKCNSNDKDGHSNLTLRLIHLTDTEPSNTRFDHW